MPVFIALLRAVNVGGTGKPPMSELKALCVAAGFSEPEPRAWILQKQFLDPLKLARYCQSLLEPSQFESQ